MVTFTSIPPIRGPQDHVQLYGQVNQLIAELENLVGSGGGGGTPSGLTSVTISLSAAQIKNMFSSPVEVVAAQGANTVVLPFGVSIVYDFGSVAFNASVGAPEAVLTVDGDTVLTFVVGGEVFLSTEDKFQMQSGSFPNTVLSAVSNYTNKALFLSNAAPVDMDTGAILTSSLGAGGSGYIDEDTFSFDDGNATGQIKSVDGGGAVLTYIIVDPGTAYKAPETVGITGDNGGTGATINVLTSGVGDGTAEVTVIYAVLDV